MVLKELIPNSFYIGRVWWSWKNWFLTVSILGGCGGLERTDFEHFLLWEGVVVLKELIFQFCILEGVVVLKELIFNSFYVVRVRWSWNNWFISGSTFLSGGVRQTAKNFIFVDFDWENALKWLEWYMFRVWSMPNPMALVSSLYYKSFLKIQNFKGKEA